MNDTNGKHPSTVGIVILDFNSHTQTASLVRDVVGYGLVDRICVVDNASDKDLNLPANLSKKIIQIRSNENGGYSAGNNIGLRLLVEDQKCEYVFIANPDVNLNRRAFESCIDALQGDTRIGAISTIRSDAHGNPIHQYFDFPSFRSAFVTAFAVPRRLYRSHRIIIQNRRLREQGQIVEVDAVPGAFVGLRSKALQEVGYLDERLFLYGEEVMLGQELKRAGYKSAIVQNASYRHEHDTAPFQSVDIMRWDRQSQREYFRKYHPSASVRTALLRLVDKVGLLEYMLLCRVCRIRSGRLEHADTSRKASPS